MSFSELLREITLIDVLDVAAVTLIVYYLLVLIRGTRAVQVLLGIFVLIGVSFAARYFGLRTLETLLNGFFFLLPFAAIVLFQNEIRRALTAFGKNPLVRFSQREQMESCLQEVVLAATTLSARRTGALIVFERLQGLRDYVENGIRLDAEVSFDLLVTIFNTQTPLHDGAVILVGDRVAAAACFLPLSANPELSSQAGSRHRAALGISEETDALAVVVSEETGSISVAVGGQLLGGLDARSLRGTLYRHLIAEMEDTPLSHDTNRRTAPTTAA